MGIRGKNLIPQKKYEKRKHFAHRVDTFSCSTASNLHNGFRDFLCDKINKAIEDKVELIVSWKCAYCNQNHPKNIIENASIAKPEKSLENTRPDITIFDSNKKPIIIIEIIYKHFPEKKTMDYYLDIEIPIIEFELKNATDSYRCVEEPLKPDRVNICIETACIRCGKTKKKEYIHELEAACPYCNNQMKLVMAGTRMEWLIEPDYFNSQETEVIKQRGLNLEEYFYRIGRKALCNKCPTCRKQVILVGTTKDKKIPISSITSSEKHEVAYFCVECRKAENEKEKFARKSLIGKLRYYLQFYFWNAFMSKK